MADKTFEERKKIIYDFINDPRYVPMKQKELAIILQVEKRRQRSRRPGKKQFGRTTENQLQGQRRLLLRRIPRHSSLIRKNCRTC